MQFRKHTVEYPVLDMPHDEVSRLEKIQVRRALEKEQAALKTKQMDMLLAIKGHPNEEELKKLVEQEFKANLVEISSGNGAYHTEWNPDIDEDGNKVDQLRMAQGTDSRDHDRSGLAEQFVDSSEGYERIDDDALTISLDGIADKNMVAVLHESTGDIEYLMDSAYSIWDTIEQKGMLIVRRLANWKNGFDTVGYTGREARRKARIHKSLLHGETGTQADDRKRTSNYDSRKQKRLQKLQKRTQARQLNQIGYHAF